MSVAKRLGILRMRHDPAQAVIDDDACRAVMTTGYPSVLKFWENSTYGHLDLSGYYLSEWFDVTLTAGDVTIPDPASSPGTGVITRNTQAQLAIDTLRADHPGADPLAGLDGLIVLTHPGTAFMIANPLAGEPGQPANLSVNFDGGSGGTGGFGFCALPVMPSTMSFAAHEVGHVLGLGHSFGVLNAGSDWSPAPDDDWLPQYGSPYDIMSAEQYGGGSPTFMETLSAAAGVSPSWPGGRWVTMGPALSAAMLYRAWPDALAGRSVERTLPAGSGTGTVRIEPARRTRAPVALILRPPGADPADPVGSVVVEYRTAVGWDAGLDTIGTDASRVGVVVHEIVDTGTGQGVQPWYRGNIIDDGLRDDLVVPGRNLVISASFGYRDDGAADHVTLRYRRTAPSSVTIVSVDRSDVVTGGEVDRTSRTPCGDTVSYGHWRIRSAETFGARVAGLESTRARTDDRSPIDVEWRVGTETLADTDRSVTIMIAGSPVTLAVSIDTLARTLRLEPPAGVGASVPIRASVVDPAGRKAKAGPVVFETPGTFDGIRPDDIALLGACIAKNIPRLVVVPGVFTMPPDPRYLVDFWRVLADSAINLFEVDAEIEPDARQAVSAVQQIISISGEVR
ncbi:hypothetical protein AAFP30_14970 [Gordonia sp. CPCC 205515]|uniref:hypothetical protein n=1 Tax=Gordonia sp. CPCC 205515 TaxID=3140791 RepID=UPI003AF374AC